MKDWVEGQQFKTYKGFDGMEFTVSRSEYEMMTRHFKKPETEERKLDFKKPSEPLRIVTPRTVSFRKSHAEKERDARRILKQKRQKIREQEIRYLKSVISSEVRTSKYSSISTVQRMCDKLVRSMSKFYKNKAFPFELKQMIDRFVSDVQKAYNEFEKEYVSFMEKRIEQVVDEYEHIINREIQDNNVAIFEDSEINEVVDTVYAGLLEGRYSTEADVKRAVNTQLETVASRKGREIQEEIPFEE